MPDSNVFLTAGQLWAAVVAIVAALVTCITVLFRVIMSFVTAQIASAATNAASDRARCIAETADLAMRLRQVEDRSHGELLEVSRESIRTGMRCARVIEALVERGTLREGDDESTTDYHKVRKE